jgi:hypothetical protein
MSLVNAAHGQSADGDFCKLDQYYRDYYKMLARQAPHVWDAELSDASGEVAFRFWEAYWQPQVGAHNCSLPDAQKVISDFILAEQNGMHGKTTVASAPVWHEVGPDKETPVGSHGQIHFVTFGPQSPGLILTGSSWGGLYYSRDGGVSWRNGGTDFLPLASVSHCVVHPTNSNTWFCATGDSASSPGGVSGTQSFGVYCSTNAGVSWNFVGLNLNFWGWEIYKLVFKPDEPTVIYAATSLGVWQSTNADCNSPRGVTWSQLNIDPNKNADIHDIEFQPGSSQHLYASGQIMVESKNAGAMWSPMPGTSFLTTKLVRVQLAVTPANPGLVYAVVINTDYASMYRFSVQNQSWTNKGAICTSSWPCATGSYSPPYGMQPSHTAFAVSPTAADLVYIGDVETARCLNGTDSNVCNWVNVQRGDIHTDIHEIRFSPDGTTVWAATDGGMFQSTPSNTPWIDRSDGIAVATIYGIAVAATDSDVILIGQQDNGTALTVDGGPTWAHVLGGDGLFPMIDYQNPRNMYASAQKGLRRRSDDEGKTIPFPYDATACIFGWYTFSVLNSANPNTFYAANCPEVKRTTDQGASFTPISSFGLNLIWQLYTAPSDDKYLYAWALDMGSQPIKAHLFKTKNAEIGSPIWQELPLPGRPCSPGAQPEGAFPATGIAVDPNDADTFTLAYAGYCATAPERVYKCTCIGNICDCLSLDPTPITLPAVSIDSLVTEPGPGGYLFVGTFAGVYFKNNNMNAWMPYGTGLPHVTVSELQVNCAAGKLRAATYGRGVWETSLTCPQ